MGNAASPWRKHPIWSTSARGDELAADLAHATADRRRRALRAMGHELDGAMELPAYAARVAELLEDEDEDVCMRAVKTLSKLEPAVLTQHAAAVVAKLEHEAGHVRAAALATLSKLEPAVLAQYATAVVKLLEDEDED
eukprot:4103896-Prymnesium_polylepis.1